VEIREAGDSVKVAQKFSS